MIFKVPNFELPKKCIVEIHLHGQWVPAATLQVLGEGRCRVDYLSSYLFSDRSRPISLSLPLEWEPDQMVAGIGVDPHPDRRPPPFLYDLVPQGRGRKFMLHALGLDDSEHVSLALVTAGAFNPIGNLRLDTAVAFYRDQVRRDPAVTDFDGLALDDIVKRSDDFLEHISLHAMLAAGTTGVQGVAPKFLLAQNQEARWYADLALPDEQAAAHWLVKLPRGTDQADRAILRNEAAYLSVAKACGLRTHQAPLLVGNMLFLRRFDREVQQATADSPKLVQRLHQESLASVAGLRGFASAQSQGTLVNAMRAHVTDPEAETVEFIQRDILNQALRNTDNHARNTALQTTARGSVQLTPLFDFAPMFMDPEVIPRSVHWRNADGVRINHWEQVIESLHLDDAERARLTVALQAFAEIVGRLPETAKDSGVDAGVIEQCRKAIDAQAEQLGKLPTPGPQPKSGHHGR